MLEPVHRKKREFQRREREILERASEMILREDWLSLTVESVAKATGIGKGTIYLHFRSKSDIYGALLAELKEELLQKLKELPPASSSSDSLRQSIKLIWNYYQERELYTRRLVRYCDGEEFFRSLSPPLQERVEKLQFRFLDHFRLLLEAGGFPLPAPLEPLLVMAASTLEGALRIYWGLDPQTKSRFIPHPEEFAEGLAEFILRGTGGNT